MYSTIVDNCRTPHQSIKGTVKQNEHRFTIINYLFFSWTSILCMVTAMWMNLSTRRQVLKACKWKSNYLPKSIFAFAKDMELLSLWGYIKCPCKPFFPFRWGTVAHNLIMIKGHFSMKVLTGWLKDYMTENRMWNILVKGLWRVSIEYKLKTVQCVGKIYIICFFLWSIFWIQVKGEWEIQISDLYFMRRCP